MRARASITTCRSTGHSGRWWRRSTFPSTCIRVIPCRRRRRSMRAIPGCWVFDKHPRLLIILGHLGEGLPYSMWRVDNHNAWVKWPQRYPAKKKIADYFHANFYITTSGNFRTQSLIDAILEIGADRILFSIDWPFENIDHATDWFDSASISEDDRLKIGRLNAIRLLKLESSVRQPTG